MIKVFKILTLSFLLIVAVFIAIIESGPGQRAMQKKLIASLKQSGIHIEAQIFGGQLPKTMDLTNAVIFYKDKTVKIDHLWVEIALFPLFQKKIFLERFKAVGVQFEEIGVNLEGELVVDFEGNGSISLDVEGPFKGHIAAKGTIDEFSGKAQGSYRDFSFTTDLLKKEGNRLELSEIHIAGYDVRIEGALGVEKDLVNGEWRLETAFGSKPLIAAGSLEGRWSSSHFDGAIQGKGQFLRQYWTFQSPLVINESQGIGVSNLDVRSPFIEGKGQLFWKEGLSGQLELSALNNHLNIDFNQKIWSCSVNFAHIIAELKGVWQEDRIVLEEGSGEYLDLLFTTMAPTFVALDKTGKVTSGRCNVQLKPEEESIGKLNLTLENNRLHILSTLNAENTLGSVEADLPFSLNLWPLHIDFPPEELASAKIAVSGQMEKILDFFHLGMHRLEGDVAWNMAMKGTLSHPQITGSCKIENGYYENYLTGTELTSINAKIVADGPTLSIASFSAKDAKKKGNFAISGNLQATVADRFPFHLQIDFTRMNIVQIDLIAVEAEGHVTVDGDLRSALAKGQIEIVEAEISIPDKIPRSYPDLPVVYKGRAPSTLVAAEPRTSYPLNLEIEINAPDGVFIDGRGLHSEWHGHFTVGGTFTNPSGLGKLELRNGEFVFVGRRFKLHEGALSLKGKAYEMPTINIAGTTSEKGISITAHLVGPLNKPQITFQSSPPLPISGILSYLLFGQDLSEVSGIQALQLAGTIATFAGEGPDILELTRKSLGVDRLQIVMTPGKTEGEETIALQVGKIVFPGFLVSIKQGADDSSPNIAIEVDLTHGFTFGAESEQQPAQGKFSILWNLNY